MNQQSETPSGDIPNLFNNASTGNQALTMSGTSVASGGVFFPPSAAAENASAPPSNSLFPPTTASVVQSTPEDMAALSNLLTMYNNDLGKVQAHLSRESERLRREQERASIRPLSTTSKVHDMTGGGAAIRKANYSYHDPTMATCTSLQIPQANSTTCTSNTYNVQQASSGSVLSYAAADASFGLLGNNAHSSNITPAPTAASDNFSVGSVPSRSSSTTCTPSAAQSHSNTAVYRDDPSRISSTGTMLGPPSGDIIQAAMNSLTGDDGLFGHQTPQSTSASFPVTAQSRQQLPSLPNALKREFLGASSLMGDNSRSLGSVESNSFSGSSGHQGALSRSLPIGNKKQASFSGKATNIQTLLRLHSSSGGKKPDAEGFYPIHLACRDFPTNARLIGTMLCTNPGVGRLKVLRGSMGTQMSTEYGRISPTFFDEKPLPKRGLQRQSSSNSFSSNKATLAGSYPIHIALQSSASHDVVKLLVRQHPELLVKGDGANRVPLSIALRRGSPLVVLSLLLGTNPRAAAMPDARNNYPLHHACARRTGSEHIELPFLKRLVQSYPAAVHERNFNGSTPLDIAQSCGLFDDDAISYLHEMAYKDDEVIEAPN